jgi:uncharacterized repeat protein (TIGR04076 family)
MHENFAPNEKNMNFVYDIKCEVIENEFCPYVEKEYVIGRLTPNGMCAASFSAIWPFANAMPRSEKTAFENPNGEVTITCPDGWVQFRLSRIDIDKPSFSKQKS